MIYSKNQIPVIEIKAPIVSKPQFSGILVKINLDSTISDRWQQAGIREIDINLILFRFD